MSGSIVSVPPGPPTQIAGSSPTDSILYNQDTVNAIWVSSSPGVTPGSGLRIGPLGNVTWNKSNNVAWACVDTGVTTPVNVNVSNDGSNPTNPVDVAASVAAQLLANGVPSVFLNTSLLNTGNSNEVVIPANGSVSVNTYQYSSLILTVNNILQNICLYAQFSQYKIGALSQVTNPYAEYFTAPQTASNAVWNFPVRGSSITLQNLTANAVHISLWGSNAPCEELAMIGRQSSPRFLNLASQALVAGTRYQLLNGDGVLPASDNCTYFNDQVELAFAPSAALTAYIVMELVLPSGNISAVNPYGPPIAMSTSAPIRLAHPKVPVRWYITPNANITSGLTLQITPVGDS